jgi:hypothetical protein
MQEAEVLVTLAEIAGVFVGFGALIAVRSGGPSDVREVSYIRSVLMLGVWVVVAGLAPATLGGYDLSSHDVWFLSSLIALVSAVALWAVGFRTPESRAVRAGLSRPRTLETAGYVEAAGYVLLGVPMLGALILVVLGLFPDQEAALYLTAVVLGLFVAALTLLWLVFAHRGTATASDEAELPAS